MTNHRRRLQTRNRHFGTNRGWNPHSHNRVIRLRKQIRQLSRATRSATIAFRRLNNTMNTFTHHATTAALAASQGQR